MTVVQAIILAIVEGLTEFLPVSSTGHLVIAQSLMGIESTPFVKAFTVMIQFGAILSVVVLYWKRFFDFRVAPEMDHPDVPTWKRNVSRFRFYIALLIGLLRQSCWVCSSATGWIMLSARCGSSQSISSLEVW